MEDGVGSSSSPSRSAVDSCALRLTLESKSNLCPLQGPELLSVALCLTPATAVDPTYHHSQPPIRLPTCIQHTPTRPHHALAQVDGEVAPHHLELDISLAGGSSTTVKGRLDVGQLADHPAAVAALWGALKPGARLEGLLVLQRLEVGGVGWK